MFFFNNAMATFVHRDSAAHFLAAVAEVRTKRGNGERNDDRLQPLQACPYINFCLFIIIFVATRKN
jgi:hypothetical protein